MGLGNKLSPRRNKSNTNQKKNSGKENRRTEQKIFQKNIKEYFKYYNKITKISPRQTENHKLHRNAKPYYIKKTEEVLPVQGANNSNTRIEIIKVINFIQHTVVTLLDYTEQLKDQLHNDMTQTDMP